MKRGKRFLNFFVTPSLTFTIALWTVGLALLGLGIAALALDMWFVGVRIAIVIAATLALLYALYAAAVRLRIPQKAARLAQKNKHLKKFLDSYHFRTVVYSAGSVFLDTCYAVFEIAVGYSGGSHWFRINGLYYLLLCAIRVAAIMFVTRPFSKTPADKSVKRERSVRAYAGVGVALFGLNLLLYTLFDIMLAAGSEFTRHAALIYVTAVFTFYKTVFAIGNFIRSRLTDDLMTKALRNINIVTAFVSLLTFQTTLLSTYPETASFTVANGTTATVVSVVTVSLALSMIIKAFRETRHAERLSLTSQRPRHEKGDASNKPRK